MKKSFLLISTFICLLSFISCKQETVPQVPEKKVPEGVILGEEAVGDMKESEVLEKLKVLASRMDIQVKDALLDPDTWVVTQKEQPGRKVNVQKTLENLLNAADGDKVDILVEEVKTQATVEKMKKGIVEIGSYTTRILDSQDSRMNNIEIASEAIDYYKIAPGEVFSFNDALGKRTKGKGYEVAPVIIKTEEGYKKGYGVGGGICQLSSTLFNVSEKCGMEIIERHQHSKDVGYVPKGRDATVSYGSTDFKFRNSRQYPVMIRTYLTKRYLTVKILENRN